jgi:hypothetical protein
MTAFIEFKPRSRQVAKQFVTLGFKLPVWNYHKVLISS